MQTNVSMAQARQYLSALVQKCSITGEPAETLSIARHPQAALGRILARAVISPLSVPPHDNAAMDGYAFNGDVLQRGSEAAAQASESIVLHAVGNARAGAAWSGVLARSQCVAVTTGAVMPQGADTVIPSEWVHRENSLVRFAPHQVSRGENRRLRGEDLTEGSVALAQGARINSAALGLIASLGIEHIEVYPRLRVACFSTGNEVLSLGESPRMGAIYDSNSYSVLGMLERLGCVVVSKGVVQDDPQALMQALRAAAEQADVIITSAGVSVGEADYTRDVMRRLAEAQFWRIAMRPGRPMAVGTIAREGKPDCMLFGLPGNPVAVIVTFLALVRPALLRMMGAHDCEALMCTAIAEQPMDKKAGRTEYLRGHARLSSQGQLFVALAGNQGSGVLSSVVQSNCLVVLPQDRAAVAAGEQVSVLMLEGLL